MFFIGAFSLVLFSCEEKYSDDDFLRRLLGYDSDPADHVDAWRKERLEVREGKGYHPGYEVS